MQKVEIGRYKHFKGNYYKVLGVAKHSETLEEMVVYQPLYDKEKNPCENLINCDKIVLDNLWVRSVKMFCENVEHNGVVVKRFEKVSDN